MFIRFIFLPNRGVFSVLQSLSSAGTASALVIGNAILAAMGAIRFLTLKAFGLLMVSIGMGLVGVLH